MKKLIRSATVASLLLTLFLGMIPKVSAAYGEVIFHGKSEKFSFKPGSGYTSTDMFGGFKNAMPGDTLSESITVTNRSWDGDYIKLYLRAVPHNAENPLSYSEHFEQIDGKDQSGIPGRRDETAFSSDDFLSQLILRIDDGERVFYEDSLSASGILTDGIYLGFLRRYHSQKLNLELEVPAHLDNRYANRVGEVDWIFTAEVFEEYGKTDVPKTGDRILAAVSCMSLSVFLLAMISIHRKRR